VPDSFLQDLPKAGFTRETITRMYRLVDNAKTDPQFQKLIRTVVNRSMHGQWKDYRRELETVLAWFKGRHNYRRDPYGVELLQDVWATLDRKSFDCDCASIFLASAAEVLGAPARFVTVSTRADKDPSHVYVQAYVGGDWVGMDAIMPESVVGWEPTDTTAKRVWDRKAVGLSGDDDEPTIEGLGMSNNGFYQVNPEGLESDIASTWARPHPGQIMLTHRLNPSKTIMPGSEPAKTDRAGGGEYEQHQPIRLSRESDSIIDSGEVPVDLDPTIWSGAAPTHRADPDFCYPQPHLPQDEYLKDLAGLNGLGAQEAAQTVAAGTIANLANKALTMLTAGLVPDVATAVSRVVGNYAEEKIPPAASTPGVVIQSIIPQVYTPSPLPPKAPAMPAWVIPAAIGGAVLLFLGMKKGKRK